MLKCPKCDSAVEDWMVTCPECDALLPESPGSEPAAGAAESQHGFAKFCLGLGMLSSLIGCVISVFCCVGLFGSGLYFYALIVGPLSFCLLVAEFVVFQKVRQLLDFTPPIDASET